MKYRQKQLSRWMKQVPALGGGWDRWWLEADGALILITDDLRELLEKVEKNYGKFRKIYGHRAKRAPDGDAIYERGYRFELVNYEEDLLMGWAYRDDPVK